MRTGEIVDFTKMRLGSRYRRRKITVCLKCGRKGQEGTMPGGNGVPDARTWNHLAEVYVIPGIGGGLSVKERCFLRAEGPLPNR